MGNLPVLRPEQKALLFEGTVIPAHPLALNEQRRLDERRQQALTRYYVSTGAGGMAVGVHTTQFGIRDSNVDLLEPVLSLAAQTADEAIPDRPFLKVAGICGPTDQALAESELAAALGYDLGLLSMDGLESWSEEELINRAQEAAKILPIFGFYLQPAVGGRAVSYDFWQEFAEIQGVMAIKIAPFNRYQTLNVVRAVCESSRRSEIALYTGNDDSFVIDLLTTYRFSVDGKQVEKQIVGGLLGQWAVWTKRAVELLEEIKRYRKDGARFPQELLTRSVEWTDVNAGVFDAAHNFRGVIPGIHEVLRRQGLLAGAWCLDPKETLSPGQMAEIDRVYRDYPYLNDDAFVREHLNRWLR